MKAKLTARAVNALKPADKPYKAWDTEVKGLFVRISPAGTKTYVLYYRVKGKANEYTLGRHGKITADIARDLAKEKTGEVAKEIDIQSERKAKREATKKARHSTLGNFIKNKYKPWAESELKDPAGALWTLNTNFKHLHDRKLSDITPWVVESWIKKAKTGTKTRKGLQPSTINRRVSVLKSALSKAVEWGVIEQSPLKGMRRQRTDKMAPIRYLTEDEEEGLRGALEARQEQQRERRASHNRWLEQRHMEPLPPLKDTYTDHLMPMVLLAVNTGTRRGELFNLEWSDIDLRQRLLTVQGKGAKSGTTRYIPLNDEAFAVLVAWRNQTDSKALVLPSPITGERMDHIKSSWRSLMKLTAVRNFRFHDLRHHFASKLVMAGVDLNTVRELLGHSSIEMTLRYAHLEPQHKAAAVALLNRKELADDGR